MTSAIHGGEAVHGGYYLDLSHGTIVAIERDGARLPEGKGSWRRIPTLLALVLTPVVGGIYLLTLPLVGFARMVQALAARAARGAREGVMAHVGEAKVKGGYYWCPRSWAVHVIPPEGGRLPGPAGARFVKVPFPLLFVLVPVMGGLFLVSLPLIGFGLFAHAVGRKASARMRRSAAELASTVTPGWQPGEAHFTGKPGDEPPAKESKVTQEIEKLEREIEERRGSED